MIVIGALVFSSVLTRTMSGISAPQKQLRGQRPGQGSSGQGAARAVNAQGRAENASPPSGQPQEQPSKEVGPSV